MVSYSFCLLLVSLNISSLLSTLNQLLDGKLGRLCTLIGQGRQNAFTVPNPAMNAYNAMLTQQRWLYADQVIALHVLFWVNFDEQIAHTHPFSPLLYRQPPPGHPPHAL